MLETLPKKFASREALVQQVLAISPPELQPLISDIRGGREAMAKTLHDFDVTQYALTRNYLNGQVSKLSPYIRHGLITTQSLYNLVRTQVSQSSEIEKFAQELVWRDFWRHVLRHHPEWLWSDAEPYKTGFRADEYADKLPKDIATGKTGVACIDAFCQQLIEQGYLHNHARMYLAAYVVHWRRVKWQAGAAWFLHHLLDGDEASNNFSWQWVASTFSQRPYIFNLENVQKYASAVVDVSPENNQCLQGSYAELSERLFPRMRRDHD